jgi:hypothetical protein
MTALPLERCDLRDEEAVELISGLTGLCSLVLDATRLSEDLQLPVQLTYLQLDCKRSAIKGLEAVLKQLPALVDLQHLKLTRLDSHDLPDGVPYELSKLTCLGLDYRDEDEAVEQFDHLSSLTALQQLSVGCEADLGEGPPGTLPGMQHLTQLTHLALSLPQLVFSNRNMDSWTCLTALQTLELDVKLKQLQGLSELTQLRDLSIWGAAAKRGTALSDLLDVVPQLSLLTALCVSCWGPTESESEYQYQYELDSESDSESESESESEPQPPAAAAFTALAASTNLHSLHVTMCSQQAPDGCVIFRPGVVYPHLQHVSPEYNSAASTAHLWELAAYGTDLPMSPQQLKQVCRACPNLHSLAFQMPGQPPKDAIRPLLQLTQLTRLGMGPVYKGVVAVVAQLTGLKQLRLWTTHQAWLPVNEPVLMRLTALTA